VVENRGQQSQFFDPAGLQYHLNVSECELKNLRHRNSFALTSSWSDWYSVGAKTIAVHFHSPEFRGSPDRVPEQGIPKFLAAIRVTESHAQLVLFCRPKARPQHAAGGGWENKMNRHY
jgi:hypothetical protein